MNTIDIKYNSEIGSFDDLYRLAIDQFLKYEEVEKRNWDEYDFSIDCAADQAMFKDMLQIRFVEELTEASCSINESEEHFWEEIGDALNFFLSSYIMLDVDFNSFISPEHYLPKESHKTKIDTLDDFSLAAYPVIEKVGYLCNLLKNRPWAESNYLVSEYDFDLRLRDLWQSFWQFLGDMGLNRKDIFEIFYKKYKVNEHRRSTGY
jgi:hypothetical protein